MCKIFKIVLRFGIFCFAFLMTFANPCDAQIFDGTNLSVEKPFYGAPPYSFRGTQAYYVAFKTSPDIVKSLVPAPLVPDANSVISLVFCKHHIISPLKFDYFEVYFTIPVSYQGIHGGYMPILYLDRVEGILPGRELWGYNKINAKIQFNEENGVTNIVVSRLDTIIINANFILAESVPPLPGRDC